MSARLAVILCLVSAPVLADSPRVVADIAPVHGLVARVMQGVGEPDLILPPGASAHSYSMRTSEAAALERADVVFWIGHELTPWLERPLETLSGNALNLSLLEVEGTVLHDYRESASEDDHHDEHADHDDHDDHDDHEGHEAHDHAGGVDPHAWLDPVNGALWMAAIADELATVDPENAATYRANAEAGAAELSELLAQMAANLATPPAFAVYHDAYQYFEHRFGLEPSFTIADSHAVAPGPKRIAELRDMARNASLSCVFAEPQENTGIVETVVEGTDAKVLSIDPLGASLTPSAQLYMELMQSLGASFAACGADQ